MRFAHPVQSIDYFFFGDLSRRNLCRCPTEFLFMSGRKVKLSVIERYYLKLSEIFSSIRDTDVKYT